MNSHNELVSQKSRRVKLMGSVVTPTFSSVARGGGGGGSSPPHWLVKYAKTHVFCAFEVDFLWKMENSPPHTKRAPPQTFELAKLGRKITLNFGEDLFFFFFFGDHLILGGKNLWISDVSETFRLKFRTNRLKLIQGQWKFESTSYAHFSLFQNSPPLFQILATRLPTFKTLKNLSS